MAPIIKTKRELPLAYYQQIQKQRPKKYRLVQMANSDRPFPVPFFQQQQQNRSLPWGPFLKLPTPSTNPFGDIFVSKQVLTEEPQDIGRQFMVIKFFRKDQELPCYQLFYRSSGANSQTPHVWFPCDGLVYNYGLGMVYAKCTKTRFSKTLLEDQALLKKLQHLQIPGLDADGALARFGTAHYLYISYLLGGASLWEKEAVRNILGDYINADLSVEPLEYALDRHIVRAITSDDEINWFARYALSVNYFPEEYNHAPYPELLDYNHLYKKKFEIGSNLKKDHQCSMHLYIEYEGRKLIPIEILHYWDLVNTTCGYAEGYFRHLLFMIKKKGFQ